MLLDKDDCKGFFDMPQSLYIQMFKTYAIGCTHTKKEICIKKRGLSSPDHWKTLGKKEKREREETGLSFEVVCSTLGISVSIYYLWFHFICVTHSFACIRRTTSFALMSKAEISWLCSGDVKNLWTDSQIQIMSSLAQSGQWDMLKSTL